MLCILCQFPLGLASIAAVGTFIFSMQLMKSVVSEI